MSPDDSNLESDVERPIYTSKRDSSSQAYVQTGGSGGLSSLFRFNRLAVALTLGTIFVIMLVGGASFLLGDRSKPEDQKSSIGDNYTAGNLSVDGVEEGERLAVGQADRLAVNGRLEVGNTLVLSPTTVPTAPTAGQIYYDQTTNAPYYYNGQAFVSLTPTVMPQHVTSIGGISGAITIGNGLQVTNGQLQANVQTTGVASITAATPNIVVSQDGNGNYTLSSSAVVGSGSAGQIALFTGGSTIGGSILSQSGTSLNAAGSLTVTGAITVNTLQQSGAGQDISINAANDDIIFTAGGRSFIFPTSGGASQTICTTTVGCSGGGGGGTGVMLQPGSAQIDSGAGSSIYINNTGGGNLIQLQGAGGDRFVVTNAGNGTLAGTLTVSGSSISVGTSLQSGQLVLNDGSSNTGSLVVAALGQNTTYTLPDPGGAAATICLSTGNCSATGSAGGDLTGTYPNPTIARLQGATLTISSPTGGQLLLYNGSAWVNQALSGDVNVSSGGAATIQNDAVTTVKILNGNVTNAKLQNSSVTVTAGNGLSGGGAVALGASTSLSVVYGAVANTAVQGSTTLTCASGSGNLSGGGNTITLGSGGSCNNITISNSPSFSGTVSAVGLTNTGNYTQTGTGTFSTGTGAVTINGATTISTLNSAGVVHTNASGLLSTGDVVLGTETSGSYVANLGTLTGLSVTGNSGEGSTPNLSVVYGSGANQAVQGNTTFTCPSGTGNLTGGGNSITLGTGGSCNNLTVVNSPTFSGTLSVQGAGGITIGVAGTTAGVLNLANSTNTNLSAIQAAAPSGSGTATYTLPSIAGGAADTICLVSLGNCAGSGTGVTASPGGNDGFLAKFSGSGQNIGSSTLSESGTVVTGSGSLVIQGSGGITVGTAGSVTGNLNLANNSSARMVVLQGLNPSGTGNAAVQIPTIAGGSTDTVCLQSLANCLGGGSGAANTALSNLVATSINQSLVANANNSLDLGSSSVAWRTGYFATSLQAPLYQTADTSVASTNSANLIVRSGNASGATSNSGNVTIDVGTATATAGTLNLGTSNASAVSISRTGVATTVNGSLTVSQASTFNGNVGISGSNTFTTGSGTVTLGSLTAGLVVSDNSGVLSSGAVDRNSSTYFNTALSVANGGTGTNTLAANGILYGNGTSAIQATAAAANSVLVTNGSSVPSLSQTLPTVVQDNITRTGALATGSIANGFGTISTANDITTSATLQGNTVTVGTAGSTVGNLQLANATSSRMVVLQGLNPSGTGNATIQFPSLVGGSTDTVCLLTLNNCGGGSASTLQDAYNNDANGGDAIITLTSNDGGILVRDAASALGTNLFAVQSNDGSTTYLGVTASGTSVVGGLQATGGAVSLNASSNFDTNINTGTSTGTVNIGTGTGTQSLNFGTGGTGAKTVTIGDDSVAGSSTVIQGGSTNGIQAQADSVNAFRVQNAAGSTTLLAADTTYNKLTVTNSITTIGNISAGAAPSVSAGSNTGGTLSGNATNNQRYYYRVTAITPGGETAPTAEGNLDPTSFTPISAPGAPTVATGAAGVLTGAYTYKITFQTANGETTGGTTSATVNPSAQQVNLTNIPTGPAGTESRRIYRTAAGGADGTQKLVVTLFDNTTTNYTDNTADSGLAISLPSGNTARTNTNQATVTFTSVAGATSYRVYRSTVSGNFTHYQTTSSSPFTDTGATGTTGSLPGALQVQNSTGVNVLAVDTATSTVQFSGLASCDRTYTNAAGTMRCGTATDQLVSKLRVYGNSIAAGGAASDIYNNRFTARVSRMLGAQEDNRAISGSAVAYDDSGTTGDGGFNQVLQKETRSRTSAPYLPETNAYLAYWGINDLAFYAGGSSSGREYYINALRTVISRFRSAAVFEAENASNGVVYGGTWNDTHSTLSNSGTGYKNTSQNGATYTISVPADFPGGTVAVGLPTTSLFGWGGTHTWTVDGGAAGSYDTTGKAPAGESSAYIKRFTNLSPGSHTIVGTVSGITGFTFFDYWQIEANSTPLTVLPLTNRLPNYSYYGNNSILNDNDIKLINDDMRNLVTEFDSSVITVDLDSVINKDPTIYTVDMVHPNDIGHAKIAAAIYRAISEAPLTVEQMAYSAGQTSHSFSNEVFRNGTDTSTAFQIQNAAGATLLNVDTSITTNLVTNGGIEGAGITGWTAKGSSTLSQSTTHQWQGNSSLSVVTTTAANDGAKYNYGFTNGQQYTLSLYAKVASGSITDVNIGRRDNGTGSDIDCLTGQTLTTSWTRFSCTFTAGAPSNSPHIYIKKTGVAAETFFIDGVQLQIGATTTPFNAGGALQISGIVNSPIVFQNKQDSTTAVQIQNSAGTSNLFVADTLNNKLGIGVAPTSSGGLLQIGTNTTTAAGGVSFGTDTSLFRVAAGQLSIRTDQNTTTGLVVRNDTNNTLATAALTLNSADSTGYLLAAPSNYSVVTGWADRLNLYADSTAAGINLIAGAAAGDLRIFTGGLAAGNERLRIDSTGNVGIGSTSPDAKLHLVGGGLCVENAESSCTGLSNGDVAINGGDLITTAATFNLLQGSTDINFGPTGNAASTIDISGGSSDTGCTIDGSNGNLICSGTISSGANQAFLQNGNSFGGQGVLGTNDNNSLALETNGTTRWILGTDGHLIPNVDDTYDIGSNSNRVRDIYTGPGTIHVGTSTSDEGTISYNTTSNNLTIGATNGVLFQNSADSTTAFSIQNAASADLLVVDTQNGNIKTSNIIPLTGATSTPVNITDLGALADDVRAVIGSDNFSRIVYIEDGTSDLKLIVCSNSSCTSSTTTNLETAIGSLIDIKMGSDGFVRVLYTKDNSGDELKYLACNNANCTAPTITTVASTPGFYDYLSVSNFDLTSSDTAKIAYVNGAGGTQDVYLLDCTNNSCSTNNSQQIDTGNYYASNFINDDEFNLAVAVGSNDFARVVYVEDDTTDTTSYFVNCSNADCSSSSSQSLTTLPTASSNSILSSVAIASDGTARITSIEINGFLNIQSEYRVCSNANCTSSTTTSLDGYYSIFDLDSNDMGQLINIQGASFANARYDVVQCTNSGCTQSRRLNLGINFSSTTTITPHLDNNELIIAVYSDQSNDLKYFRYLNDTDTDLIAGASVGSSTANYGSLHAKYIDLQGGMIIDNSGRQVSPAIAINGGGTYLRTRNAAGLVNVDFNDASSTFIYGDIYSPANSTSFRIDENEVEINAKSSSSALNIVQLGSGNTLSVSGYSNSSLIEVGGFGDSVVGLNLQLTGVNSVGINLNSLPTLTSNYLLTSTKLDIRGDGQIALGGDMIASNSSDFTSETTSGVGGSNVTTITLANAAFADNDVILVDNTGGSGQDYYTRIVSGGGTTSLTVSPAVSYGTAAGYTGNATITKYNIQNIGAQATDYSNLANRFFQGYFLGGVVTGAGSTTLSDGNLSSTGTLKISGTSVQLVNTADSTDAYRIQKAGGTDTLFAADTTNNRLVVGNATGTDTNTTLLVVDSATTDPTTNVVNGAIFYNSTTNKFRCYQNSAWTDCIGGGAGSTTLQQAYDADGNSSEAEILLSNNDGTLVVRNPSSSGISSGAALLVDQQATGAIQGLRVESAGTGALVTVRDTTATAQDVFTIADGGATTLRNQANSTTALQVQNAAGTSLINVDTSTNVGGNLLSNGSFELDTAGWSANFAGVSRTTAEKYNGNAALQVVTEGAVGDGAYHNYTFSPNTQYTFSLYVKTNSQFSGFGMGRQDNGSDIDCLTNQTVRSNGWIKMSCSFVTGGTINSSRLYIKQTDSGGRTMYIDSVQLVAGPSAKAFSEGAIKLDAVITSPVVIQSTDNNNSNYAFEIQGSNGASVLRADTLNNAVRLATPLFMNGFNNVVGPTGTGPPTLSTSAAGGSLPNSATYYYRVAPYYRSAGGRAIDTTPTNVTTSSATSSNTISWAASDGAQGYFVYRSSDGGTTYYRLDVGNVTSYTDTSDASWSGVDRASESLYNFASSVLLRTGGAIVFDSTNADSRIYESPQTNYLNFDALGYRFKNNVDGTTAFQIQKANGTDVLTVDTTNSKLYVRNATDEAVIGSDIVTSLDFTSANWTNCNGGAGGWSGTATNTTHNTGNTVACSSAAGNFTVTAGTTYRVVFTIAGNTTSTNTVSVSIGGTSTTTGLGANATHTVVLTATNTSALTFTPTTNFNGTISAVTVRPITLSSSALAIRDSTNTSRLEVRAFSNNTAIGQNALQAATSSATLNTAVGNSALMANTSGQGNTALGASALAANTSGDTNTAIGHQALQRSTTASNNIAIGSNALQSTSTGGRNVAVGVSALITNTVGEHNVAIGYNSLDSVTSGARNTAIGYEAGASVATGTDNVFLGYQAGLNETGSNKLYISNTSTSTPLILGDFSANTLTLNASTTIGSATTDATQRNLQLDSYNTKTDSGTCNTTTNQGALYYNTVSNEVRGCTNGAWRTIVDSELLGLQLFGVVPDSGSNPGDLVGIVGNGTGPCKVVIGSTTNTISWSACTAYSGGRKVVVAAATNQAVTTTLNQYQHLCLTGGDGAPALSASNASETANYPAFSATAPILCLATIKTSGTAITQIYDERTFTTSTKHVVNIVTTAPTLGMVVSNNTTTAGQYIPSNSNGGRVVGVVVATAGDTTANTMNAIIATAGPAYLKATAGTVGDFIQSNGGSTVGHVNTTNTEATVSYTRAGVAQSGFSSACGASADNCRGSLFTILMIR